MKTLTQTYYTYKIGEFLPVYVDGQLANKQAFHRYKARMAVLRLLRQL